MIRNKKNLLFLLIISIVFFTGINRVSARNARNDMDCTYQLPFTGINPSSGKYYKMQNEFPCYSGTSDSSYQDCSVVAVIDSSDVHLDSNYTGIRTWIFKIKILGQNDIIATTYNELYGYGNHNSDKSKLLFGAKNEALSCKGLSSTDSSSWCENKHSYFDNPNKKDSHIYLKSTDGKCHKYLILKIPNEALQEEYKTLLYDKTDSQRGYISWDHIYYGSAAKEAPDMIAYQVSDNDEVFKNSLKNFNHIPTENAGTNSFKIKGNMSDTTLYKNTVLTLVDSGMTDKDDKRTVNNSYDIEHGTGIYRDIVIKAWIDLINKLLTNMETNCGSDFGKYINLKNYKNDVPASPSGSSSKSYAFVEYGLNGKNYDNKKLTSADKDITSKCWNARADYLNAYKTFRAFMYSIGATTDGDVDFDVDNTTNKVFAKAILKDNDVKHASNNIVFDWDSLVCFFKFIRHGVDDDNFSSCSTENKSVKEKQENSKKVVATGYAKDLFYKDRCAYKCFGTLSTDDILKKSDSWFKSMYSTCTNPTTGAGSTKKDGSSYNDCKTAMKECGGYTYTEKENECKNSTGGNTTSFEQCIKQYETKMSESTYRSCMDGKISNYSSDSDEMHENSNKAYEEAVDAYSVSETFKFKDAGLLRFGFGTKRYEPKCKDISFLTSAWRIITVLAPFLLIIYSSFDYFKVVMAGDEEKMKVAKKKVPRRIIALVLLLIFPTILSSLVSTFGTHRANNTKYIRCILTGDLGENESDDVEEDDNSKEENQNN